MSSDEHALSIGAVARLTNIPTDTIRTWERRYKAVTPSRTESGHRLYSPEDVDRLRMLSHLADQGERVSDLASLTEGQLRERLVLHGPPIQGIPRSIRATVVHSTLSERLPGGVVGVACEVQVVASAASPSDLLVVVATDVLVVDLVLLGDDPLPVLRSLVARVQPAATVVTTALVSRPLRQKLLELDVRLVQQPVSVLDLRQAMLDALLQAGHSPAAKPADQAAPPRFSNDVLERLLNTHPELLCECPNHIAGLVIAVRQFEVYSENCSSSSVEDAALHADLARESGAMRERLEALLIRVCEHDGIDWTG
jgi:DNA-binding transcriptional MerR regulator